ncbi:late competence protein ComER [Paenibacillus abyssi]|uniref:Pyrroline-5-carboxylate reductase n=1 Tax=Paenibacillus abyssi TaxID=1340531 RepID=A0A917D550_9BACL|nr:late competence protein ComER [Paenibacillus abyssi]GGG11032.1 pyrroline-5-carboxylate reductase [Paenibacillus abyssi]
MKVGFIGTGNMGSLLIESFIRSGALLPEQITASNRTSAKAARLATLHPGLQAVPSNVEAAHGKDLVFLCIKPLEFKTVIDEIKASMQPEQMIISITSPVLLARLEEWLPCKVAKVIPSITNYVLSGASLCIYGSRIEAEDQNKLETLLGQISKPLRIEEQYTRVVSDLSSCGPAFFAFLVQKFVDAAVEETGIDHQEATALASSMLLGTGRLLTEGGLSPKELQSLVSVPGGITAEALRLLDCELNDVFNRLIRTTHAKFHEDVAKVSAAFYEENMNGS